MRILYDIFFIIFAVLYLPYFIIKGKYHTGYLQRLGIYDKSVSSGLAVARPVWVHAVSVGEMRTASILIENMRLRFPGRRFIISNTTKTGHAVARKVSSPEDTLIYFPFDLSFAVSRAVETINPSIFISIETEIWPNLISELHERGVPIALVNGRLSDASFRYYRIVSFFIGRILDRMSLFCMRTAEDGERIKKLGASEEKVFVCGNLKFDYRMSQYDTSERWAALERISEISGKSDFFVAGSTHRGEEDIVLAAYKEVRGVFPELRLVIAPRHVERTAEVCRIAEKRGFTPIRISALDSADEAIRDGQRRVVFILDVMGRLNEMYSIASVVFLGGSLIKKGGHNFVEPAGWSKPIITGPHCDNFREMFSTFAGRNALLLARDGRELALRLKGLLGDADARIALGKRAKEIVLENRGSCAQTVSFLSRYLD